MKDFFLKVLFCIALALAIGGFYSAVSKDTKPCKCEPCKCGVYCSCKDDKCKCGLDCEKPKKKCCEVTK